MENVKKHISLLGLEAQDLVTGFKGIITSISFDLYGCVQAVINRGLNKDGELSSGHWFDVNRLKILKDTPVMDVPNFVSGIQAEGKQGACEKPAY